MSAANNALLSHTSRTALRTLLMKLERRDNLSQEEKAALEGAAAASKLYRAGEDIVVEGQRPSESTLLLSGIGARYNSVADGRRQITALHVSGDFVDLHSFPLHTMDHSVVALSPCTVLLFPHEALRAATDRYPHLARLLWVSTLIDGAIHRRGMVAMGRLSSLAHLAHLVCELQTRLEVVGLAKERSFELPLKQSDLADVLGLSLVHMNRVLQELRSMQLVSWTQRRVTILDWDGLTGLAEFNPDYLHLQHEPR